MQPLCNGKTQPVPAFDISALGPGGGVAASGDGRRGGGADGSPRGRSGGNRPPPDARGHAFGGGRDVAAAVAGG